MPQVRRPRLLRLLFSLGCCLIATVVAAGKPEPPNDLPQVGAARVLRVVPEPGRFVEEGKERVWREGVVVPGAAFLKPRFANFNLAPGDVLLVRSKSGQVVEELRGLGPKNVGSFWGLAVYGEEMRFELRSRARYTRPPFEIEQVIVGDPRVLHAVTGGEGDQRSICAPEDYDDVLCYQGDAGKWANVLASAGVMTTGGGISLWCSGANVSPSNHVLTNYHCIPEAGSCENSEFVFKYYRTACNTGAPPNGDWVGFRCGQTVASSPVGGCDPNLANLDYSLHTVIGDPAATFGYVQPDPVQLSSGERIYIVQHPDGRPHEITHGEGADVVVDINTGAGTRTLRYYDTLDTEGGSSGSPIFRDSDDKMVGLHHCGGCESPGVGNRGMLMSDIYPQITDFLCTTAVVVVAREPEPPVEVVGNGDNFLDPGETWSVVPVLGNRSCGSEAVAVSATVAVLPGSALVTLLDTAVSFGNIAASASAPATTPIRFVVNEGAPCAGEVALELTAISSNGSQSHPDAEFLRAEIGSLPTTTLLFENFAAGMPTTWTIVDGGTGTGAAATWTTTNPGGRSVLVPPFAIADSDRLGSGWSMDEQLISPVIDTRGFTEVKLDLDHFFRFYENNQPEIADIDVRSTATNNNWVNLARFTSAAAGHLSLDLSQHSAADLQVRFHYYNATYEWYWAVDDIAIRANNGRVCASGPLFADGFESGNTLAWSLTSP